MALTPSNYSKLPKGSNAPDFDLPGVDGKNYSPGSFKNKKALLVVFMCNHCPYVKPKMPYLKELYDRYESKGFAMAAINSNDTKAYGEDDFGHMERVAEEMGFRFPYLLDETQNVARAYGAACTPDSFLFDSNQRLAYHGRLDDAHGKPHSQAKTNELEEAIVQLLAGNSVTVKEEPSFGCNVKWK